MYSTKTFHKNINPNYEQSYTTIGDPFKDSLAVIPGRWKEKQLVAQKCPKNADNGFFTKLEYRSEPYAELAEPYLKSQPPNKRKLGFGSKDASKRGEFTSTRATERYRDTIRQESKLADSHRDEEKEKILIDKLVEKEIVPPMDKNGNLLPQTKFLYDIGRTQVTPYDPKCARDSFYKLPKHAPMQLDQLGKDARRRLGTYKPDSTTYGEQAWQPHQTNTM